MVKKTVFMVMPFNDKDAHEVYEHCTKKVCDKFNLEVRRADEMFTTNVIWKDIVEEIQNASIIIVDISGMNPNVLYELGMAHILKQQQTIMITKEPYQKSPFDIQHFRIIHYDNTIKGGEDFEKKLSMTLSNLLKDYSLIYRDEFEFMFNAAGGDPLTWIVCLSKVNFPLNEEDVVDVGSDTSKCTSESCGGYCLEQPVGEAVKGLDRIGYVKIENGIVQLTEKGKAFASFLEDRGFVCKYVTKGFEDLYGTLIKDLGFDKKHPRKKGDNQQT